MATYDKISRDTVFTYGEENAVASFHKWIQDIFEPAYPVFFDKDGGEFAVRNLTKFPSILVQQIDTQDLTNNYIGGKANLSRLLMYVYFNHSLKEGGTRRLLRRGRDQVMAALKYAGICPPGSDIPLFPPIAMYDFSKKPIQALGHYLTVNGGIQQRFIQEDDTLQFEAMVTLSYLEKII